VDTIPDYTASFAPAATQAASAIISVRWEEEDLLYSALPEDKTMSTVSGPALLVDPQGGVLFLGVDTSQGTWTDLDTIVLPASPFNGSEIILKDIGGQANTKRITVNGNGNDIDGLASRLIVNPQEAMHLVFGGTQWSVI